MKCWLATHKSPTRKLSVDTEADWKAEQALDPWRGMQAAITAGDVDNSERRTALVLGRRSSLLLPGDRRPVGASMSKSDRFPAVTVLGSALLRSMGFERFAVVRWVTEAPNSWPSSDPGIAHGFGARD
jgi:hypothetical protein